MSTKTIYTCDLCKKEKHKEEVIEGPIKCHYQVGTSTKLGVINISEPFTHFCKSCIESFIADLHLHLSDSLKRLSR